MPGAFLAPGITQDGFRGFAGAGRPAM